MQDHTLSDLAPPLDAPNALDPTPNAHHALRRRRPSTTLRAADIGHSPSQPPSPRPSGTPTDAAPSQQATPVDDEVIHSAGGLSGSEHEVEPPEIAEAEPTDPDEPPNTPLADEKRAIVVYAARNLLNTIDTKPVGTAWFSA